MIIGSADTGNGMCNVFVRDNSGRIHGFQLPSIRASVTGDSLGLGKRELSFEWVETPEGRFVVGDDVMRISRRRVEMHQSLLRYGDGVHMFLTDVTIAKIMQKFHVKPEPIDLTVFCPPGVYARRKNKIKKEFLDHRAYIQFKRDKNPRTWTYRSVTVWPEGLGAIACFVLNENGEQVPTNALSGRNLVIDLGVLTSDHFIIQDGQFNPEAFQTSTDGGIKSHVLLPVLRDLQRESSQFDHFNWCDIDEVLRRWLKRKSTCFPSKSRNPCDKCKQDCQLYGPQNTVKLGRMFESRCNLYANWVANVIIDTGYEASRTCRSVIVVGGGAALIQKHLRQMYGDLIFDHSAVETLKGVRLMDMNAAGGLRMALANQH